MAIDSELLQGLRAVQHVVTAPAFIELCADVDQEVRQACREDTAGTLRARGIELPVEIRRVEMRVRHTPLLARQRGLRGGNFEWRFSLQVGERTWRLIHLCDAWPLDAPEAADA